MNLRVSFCLAALVAASFTAQAQTAGTASTPPPPSAWDQWVKETKNPTDWLTWGADFRIRNEYFDNVLTVSSTDPLHETDVIRFRARLWASANVMTNLSINTRLAAEPREWMKPAGFGPYKGQEGMEWRYGILDTANVKWSNILDQPMTITAGRQDIALGDFYDWWLVLDGTPGDGSWTTYLDAIRLNFEAKPIKTRFDVIYINQHARPDDPMPTIDNSGPTASNPLGYTVTEQNEQGVVLYASNKSVKNTQIDGYFIYKRDEMEEGIPNGDNANIYTLGGKVTGTPGEHWQYSAEGAYQFGEKQDRTVAPKSDEWRDMAAYGGKAKLTYLFKDKLNNQLSLGGEFLSGDDPDTAGKDEMFDLLWGRWPRWSELYIYSYGIETSGKIAQINNIGRFGPTWAFNPMKGMTASLTYNALFSPEETPTRRGDLDRKTPGVQNDRFSYNGNFRGHYLQAILKYQFNKNIQAHLWGEFIWQGDYYAGRDLMMFLRPEIMFTF